MTGSARGARRCAVLLAAAISAAGISVRAANASASAASEPPEIYAVVIGWNGGTRDLPPLRFADDDAARFAAFFRGLATPERPGQVWLFTDLDAQTQATLARAGLSVKPDGEPTRGQVLAGLHAVAAKLAGTPTTRRRALYVVYAGHGLHGRVLLKPTSGGEAALTGAELRAALAETALGPNPPALFVFLDACRSESLFSDRGATDAADFASAISDLDHRASAIPIGVLTAARNGHPAGEVARLEAGFFSHVLGSGLAGAADADGDDVVSFGELAAFVAFHTQKLTGQMPWFDPPSGDLAAGAMDHRGRRTRLQLPHDSGGRFIIAARDGRPVFAEAYQRRGRQLRFSLPAGQYLVSRQGDDHAEQVIEVQLGHDALIDLGSLPWHDRDSPRGGPAADGDADAALRFSADFSSDVVSTLAAGFLAGRERAGDRPRTTLAVDYAVAPAPLDLRGAESQLSLRLGRAVAGSVVALVAGVSR
jgi:hypothetical protein